MNTQPLGVARSYKPDQVKDCVGTYIPDHLAQAFASKKNIILRLQRSIQHIANQLQDLHFSQAGDRVDINEALATMRGVVSNVAELMPYVVCPYCASDWQDSMGCPCHGTGWLTRLEYMEVLKVDKRLRPLPKPMVAAIEATRAKPKDQLKSSLYYDRSIRAWNKQIALARQKRTG